MRFSSGTIITSTWLNDVDAMVEGQSSKTATSVGSRPLVVADRAALRALSGDHDLVWVLGQAGLEGCLYQISQAPGLSDNNGSVIQTQAGVFYQAQSQGVVHASVFGVRGDGISDDGPALNAALAAVAASQKPLTLSLEGLVCAVANTLVLPPCQGVTLRGGTIIAHPQLAPGSLLLQTNGTAGLSLKDFAMFNMVFDAQSRGGCVELDNYLRVNIYACRFIRFSTVGLKLKNSADSHECLIKDCFVFEKLYQDPGFLGPHQGVGIEVHAFDNIIDGVLSYYTAIPIFLNAHYNIVRNSHIGTGNSICTENAAFSSWIGCYFDSAGITLVNPWHTEILGSKFLHNALSPTSLITLKPLTAATSLHGLKIIGNSFHNLANSTISSLAIDRSAGDFVASEVQQCAWHDNSFVQSQPFASRGRIKVTVTDSDVISVDVGNRVPVGQVVWAVAQAVSAAPVVAAIRSLAGTVITIGLSARITGAVMVEYDVCADIVS